LGPIRGNYRETMFSPVSAGFPSLEQYFHATNGRNPMLLFSTSYGATNDRIRRCWHDGNVAQSENKKQFELGIDHIAKGGDLCTTLMIKNIPNKYVCNVAMLVLVYIAQISLSQAMFSFVDSHLLLCAGTTVSSFWLLLTKITEEPMISSTSRLILRSISLLFFSLGCKVGWCIEIHWL
jgi:hypothetical protein